MFVKGFNVPIYADETFSLTSVKPIVMAHCLEDEVHQSEAGVFRPYLTVSLDKMLDSTWS